MTKKLTNVLAMVLFCCLACSSVTTKAAETSISEIPQDKIVVMNADEMAAQQQRANPSLTGCTLEIGVASNGVEITFVTSATQSADEIGVKNVLLQEKTWYGWKDIPISNYCSYNTDIHFSGVVYTGAEKGKTYRVSCTHYAKFGSTELTLQNSTNNLVYN